MCSGHPRRISQGTPAWNPGNRNRDSSVASNFLWIAEYQVQFDLAASWTTSVSSNSALQKYESPISQDYSQENPLLCKMRARFISSIVSSASPFYLPLTRPIDKDIEPRKPPKRSSKISHRAQRRPSLESPAPTLYHAMQNPSLKDKIMQVHIRGPLS